MNADDEDELASYIFGSGGHLVADLEYDAPSIRVVDDLRVFRELRARTRLFFMTYSDLLESPLQLRRITKQGREAYYVSQQTGGPCIEWLCGARYTRDGRSFISAGFIGYRPAYYSSQDGKLRKPPSQFTTRYRNLAKMIRTDATRLVAPSSGRVYFVSPRFRAEFAAQDLCLGPPFEHLQNLLARALIH